MKKVLVASTVILLAICIWLFLALLDSALLLDDQRRGARFDEEDKAIANKALQACWVGRLEKEVDTLGKLIEADGGIVRRRDNVVTIDQLAFVIKNGRVVSVGFFDTINQYDLDAVSDGGEAK